MRFDSHRSFGDSLEEFHLRDVRRNSYVKGAVVMAGSILPIYRADTTAVVLARVCRIHDASALEERN